MSLFPVFSNSALSLFYERLASLLKSGINLSRALTVMHRLEDHPARKLLIAKILAKIQQGSDLSSAFSDFPKVFDEIAIQLTRAGELSGTLEFMLEKLVINRQQASEIKGNFLQAMTYPLILIVVSLVVLGILLLAVVPEFAAMFKKFGAELPYMTQVIINISDFLQHNIFWLVAAIVITVLAIKTLITASKSLRYTIHYMMLFIPFVGVMTRNNNIANFSSVMHLLTHADIKLVQALSISAKTMSNLYMGNVLTKSARVIAKGESLSTALRKYKIFPEYIHQMLIIGEEIGNMSDTFAQIAEFYNKHMSKYALRLKTLLEPIMILIISVLIGIMLVAMYQPIFKLNQLF